MHSVFLWGTAVTTVIAENDLAMLAAFPHRSHWTFACDALVWNASPAQLPGCSAWSFGEIHKDREFNKFKEKMGLKVN